MVVMNVRALLVALLCTTAFGCAPKPVAEVPSTALLEGTDGATHAIAPRDPDAYSVVIFFSADCHVLRAHDERVQKLAADFAPKSVRFIGVDSEVGATLERDREEAKRRGYPFPIVVDRDGSTARSLGAEFAGYTVIVDRDGAIRYRGGIDSDRVRLSEDATPYVRDALEDLLAGRAVRAAEGKALGCALRLR